MKPEQWGMSGDLSGTPTIQKVNGFKPHLSVHPIGLGPHNVTLVHHLQGLRERYGYLAGHRARTDAMSIELETIERMIAAAEQPK